MIYFCAFIWCIIGGLAVNALLNKIPPEQREAFESKSGLLKIILGVLYGPFTWFTYALIKRGE